MTVSDWRNAPLREIFDAEFYSGGLIRAFFTVVVLLFGFGIGADIIVDERLVRGQFGGAGEIGCLFPGHLPRPSPLDLLVSLRAAGCDLSSVAEIDFTAAGQLEMICNTAFAWFDPGAIVLASTLQPLILEGLAVRIQQADLVTTVGERSPCVRVSELRDSPITLGAAMLPIHALSA